MRSTGWHVADGNQIDLVPLMAVNAEEVNVLAIVPALTPDVAVGAEDDGAFPFQPGLALHLDKAAIVLERHVVATLTTEGKQHAFPRRHQSRKDRRFSPLTYFRRCHRSHSKQSMRQESGSQEDA